jgi:hypothetical protein
MVEDQRGDVAGMRVPIAHEAAALGRLVDGGFEHPEVLLGTTECEDGLGLDSRAPAAFSQT